MGESVRSKDYSAVLLFGEGQMHNITKFRHKSRKKWEKNKENLKNTKKLRITA
jgi:hypothetical protein